jgi:hypothetical protein
MIFEVVTGEYGLSPEYATCIVSHGSLGHRHSEQAVLCWFGGGSDELWVTRSILGYCLCWCRRCSSACKFRHYVPIFAIQSCNSRFWQIHCMETLGNKYRTRLKIKKTCAKYVIGNHVCVLDPITVWCSRNTIYLFIYPFHSQHSINYFF